MDEKDGAISEVERRRWELELSASIVAHDLRNYLQTIMLKVEELELQLGDSTPVVKESIATLRFHLDRMGTLLRFLGLPQEMTDDPLVPILQQIAGQVVVESEDLKIKFHVDEDNLSLRVHGGYLLPMVFGNVFQNCAVHGGNHVQVEINKKNDNAEILISDDGSDIPESIKNQLFQLGTSTKGGGLGLYLAKCILDIHEGSIEYVETNSTKGACFRILLPLLNTIQHYP